MAGTSNLVDAMLVLSVGFLIFLVLSWNMQSVVFADMTTEEKQETMQAMKQVAEVQMGKELNETPYNIFWFRRRLFRDGNCL